MTSPRGEFREPWPEEDFPPRIAALIRFYVAAKGEVIGPCPLCKKKGRGRWTMLCPFTAHETEGATFAPLTLVCSTHPIRPIQSILEAL